MRGREKPVVEKTTAAKMKSPGKLKSRKARTTKTSKGHYEYRIFTLCDYAQAWHYHKVSGVAVQVADDLVCAWERVKKGYCHRDLYDTHRWFLQTIPDMLEEFAASCMSAPSGFLQDGEAVEAHMVVQGNGNGEYKEASLDKWRRTVTQIAELLREADENQSTIKNKYDDDYLRCMEGFKEKYGLLGEVLLTEEEKENAATNGKWQVVHFMSEVPEYKEICRLHSEERQRLKEYRDSCKEEGMRMLAKWLWELWT